MLIENSEEDLRAALDMMPPKGAVLRKVDPPLLTLPKEEEVLPTSNSNVTGVTGVLSSGFQAVEGIAHWLSSQNNPPAPPPAPEQKDSSSTLIYVIGGIVLMVGLYLILRK